MCVMACQRVGVRDVRQNLSKFLDRVKRGPLPERMSALDRLIAEGRIVGGTGENLADLPPPLAWSGPPLSQLLDEAREDRI